MTEEKKAEEKEAVGRATLTLKIKLPTADDIREALIKMFPGIEITVEGEMPGKTLIVKEDEKPRIE